MPINTDQHFVIDPKCRSLPLSSSQFEELVGIDCGIDWRWSALPEEYVSLLIGLYKSNGSVSHVAIRFLFIRYLQATMIGRTFTLIPNSMGSYHGQILIETETDSLIWLISIGSPVFRLQEFSKGVQSLELALNWTMMLLSYREPLLMETAAGKLSFTCRIDQCDGIAIS